MKLNISNENFSPEQKMNYDLRHYPIRPHIGVGGVILWRDSVLLIQRKYDPDAGKWAIPGGHLKVGESTTEGALRECMEQTGLHLKIGKLAGIIDKIDKDPLGKIEWHYVLINYLMEIQVKDQYHPPAPQAQSDACNAQFVKFTDLKKYDLTKSVLILFQQLGLMT